MKYFNCASRNFAVPGGRENLRGKMADNSRHRAGYPERGSRTVGRPASGPRPRKSPPGDRKRYKRRKGIRRSEENLIPPHSRMEFVTSSLFKIPSKKKRWAGWFSTKFHRKEGNWLKNRPGLSKSDFLSRWPFENENFFPAPFPSPRPLPEKSVIEL